MILVLEPEKLMIRIISGVVIVILMVGAAFAVGYWRNKLTEFNAQHIENLKLKSELVAQKEAVAKLTNEIVTKESQMMKVSNAVTQLRERNNELEPALVKCQATVNSQKTTIKSYKDYYYYYISNGK